MIPILVTVLYRGSLESGLSHLLATTVHLTSLSVTECNLMLTERWVVLNGSLWEVGDGDWGGR